jgi:glutaredoxin 3
MVKNVTIFTSNQCAYCGMVKQYMDLKGQSYNEVNIEEQPDRQNEMISMTGQNRVPVTVITKIDGSQVVSVGYNITKLASALNA